MAYEVVAELKPETVEFQMAWSFDDTYAFLGLLLDEAVTSPSWNVEYHLKEVVRYF
jgi:hypothetical protein